MIPLGGLPGGTFASYAFETSADGSIVVGDSFTALGFEAFKWTKESRMVGLGGLPGGLDWSTAWAVSGDGSIIVGFASSFRGAEAVIWADGGPPLILGDLPGGPYGAVAVDVTLDGKVVIGISGSGPEFLEAFRWENGVMEGLGDLPGGKTESGAYAITPDGKKIFGQGWVATVLQGTTTHAMRWTRETGMIDLSGDVPEPRRFSGVSGVSDDGWVAVGTGIAGFGGGQQIGIIWDPILGWRDMNEAFPNEFGLDITGWRLGTGGDISGDGTVIVGGARNPNGDVEAWIAHIPPFCYADCDQSQGAGILDINDFLCFQERFARQDLYTDCNVDGKHDIFDFLCFQDAFVRGCR